MSYAAITVGGHQIAIEAFKMQPSPEAEVNEVLMSLSIDERLNEGVYLIYPDDDQDGVPNDKLPPSKLISENLLREINALRLPRQEVRVITNAMEEVARDYKAAANRTRLDPRVTRIMRSYRLHPRTIAGIDAAARKLGISAAQVVDMMAEKL